MSTQPDASENAPNDGEAGRIPNSTESGEILETAGESVGAAAVGGAALGSVIALSITAGSLLVPVVGGGAGAMIGALAGFLFRQWATEDIQRIKERAKTTAEPQPETSGVKDENAAPDPSAEAPRDTT